MNILITACYNLEDKRGIMKRKLVYDKYQQLTDMCVRSFRKNLKDIDEVIVLEGLAKNYHRMFQEIYYRIKEIYQTRDCNILWVDSDCVCVKSTRIFGKYDKFVMFDIQNQYCGYSKVVPRRFYQHLKPWMMANVRYYPAGAITDEMWETADYIAKNWVDVWAYECIIYNTLFHGQGLSKEEIKETIYDPNLNCQSEQGRGDIKALSAARIIHVHSTRNVDKAIGAMAAHLKKAGIP